MWFETVVRERTGCATYLIGCGGAGECAVFDPLWDPQPYLDIARAKGSRIRYVIDSHSHADHISGARTLAEASGAELILPEMAEVTYAASRVSHGDMLRMGRVGLEVIHVPGHRPEQINLVGYDFSRGDDPWFVLTADFVLVGDVSRPDLAQGGAEGAGVLYDVSIPRFLDLPDHVEVYPGHLAGST